DVGQLLGRRLGVREQADERHQRDQGREECHQPVVGEGGGPIGQVVLPELGHRAPEDAEGGRLVVPPLRRIVPANGLGRRVAIRGIASIGGGRGLHLCTLYLPPPPE